MSDKKTLEQKEIELIGHAFCCMFVGIEIKLLYNFKGGLLRLSFDAPQECYSKFYDRAKHKGLQTQKTTLWSYEEDIYEGALDLGIDFFKKIYYDYLDKNKLLSLPISEGFAGKLAVDLQPAKFGKDVIESLKVMTIDSYMYDFKPNINIDFDGEYEDEFEILEIKSFGHKIVKAGKFYELYKKTIDFIQGTTEITDFLTRECNPQYFVKIG